jgi:hypothetical protein
MQNSIHKIKYLLFLSWEWEGVVFDSAWGIIPLTPYERKTA